jgi:hypothetical protein
MCIGGKTPSIPAAPKPTPPPQEQKPMEFAEEDDPRIAKRLGTKRLQIGVSGTVGGSGMQG